VPGGADYTVRFKLEEGYTLTSVLVNHSKMEITPDDNGYCSFTLYGISSVQNIEITATEIQYTFNFEGCGADKLESASITVGARTIIENSDKTYALNALEHSAYYTFDGWTCETLGLTSVSSITWAQLKAESATEYTFTSAWTFNSQKAYEALMGMYRTESVFTVSRSADNKIVAQVTYDKEIMAGLETEMAAHGDSILATGFINYNNGNSDNFEKDIARIMWTPLAGELNDTTTNLLYLFDFDDGNIMQLKMWSYKSGLYKDIWTITGVNDNAIRSISAYIVLQVNGEAQYIVLDPLGTEVGKSSSFGTEKKDSDGNDSVTSLDLSGESASEVTEPTQDNVSDEVKGEE
jgi:hypothetical protein